MDTSFIRTSLTFHFLDQVYALWGFDYRMGLFLWLLLGSQIIFNFSVGTMALSRAYFNHPGCFSVGQPQPVENFYLTCVGLPTFPPRSDTLLRFPSVSSFLVPSCVWSLGHFKCISIRQSLRNINTLRLISRISNESLTIAVLSSGSSDPLICLGAQLISDIQLYQLHSSSMVLGQNFHPS